MAEDGAVAAEHPVVPADILIQAEHQHKAEGEQPLLTHPRRHERLEQAEVGRGHKAGKQVAEQVHAPEYLLVVVVGGGRFVVDDVADGGRKAVHDLVAEVGGRGGDCVVVAQKGRLGRAAHAGGHDGVGRAVDRVGEAMHQKIPQIVENTQLFKVVDRDFYIMHIGEVLFEPPRNEQVGHDIEENRHAEIQHIVREPERDGDLGKACQHIAAEVDLGAAVALLGAGVHQAAGD